MPIPQKGKGDCTQTQRIFRQLRAHDFHQVHRRRLTGSPAPAKATVVLSYGTE